MVIKILTVSLITSLFLKNEAHAQSNFIPGFYITNDYDTIHGLIAYQSEWKNCLECHFKKEGKEATQEFTPAEIKGFVIDSTLYFESHSVINNSTGIESSYFLKVIIDSKTGLFEIPQSSFFVINKNFYYLKDKNGRFIDLNPRRETVDEGTRTYYMKDVYTRGVLKSVTVEHEQELFPVIESTTDVNSRDVLTNIISQLNSLNGDEQIIRETKLRVPAKIYPEFRLGLGTRKIKNSVAGYKNFTFDNDQYFAGYLSGLVYFPRTAGNFFLKPTIGYSENGYSSSYIEESGRKNFATIDFKMIETKLGFSFRHLTALGLYAEIDLQADFLIENNVVWRRETEEMGETITEYIERGKPIGDTYWGLGFSFGKIVSFKSSSLLAGFTYAVSTNQETNSSMNAITFHLAYALAR